MGIFWLGALFEAAQFRHARNQDGRVCGEMELLLGDISTHARIYTLGNVKNAALQSGFTLIEVVVTIFIVVLMLVFYASSFTSNQLEKIQEHKDIVLRVINQKMASIRAGGYSNAASSAGTFTDTQLSTLTRYSASTTVSDYNANIKEVTVGVSWIDASSTLYLGETTLLVNSGGL